MQSSDLPDVALEGMSISYEPAVFVAGHGIWHIAPQKNSSIFFQKSDRFYQLITLNKRKKVFWYNTCF